MFTSQNSSNRFIILLLVCFLLLFSLGSVPAPIVQTKPDGFNFPDFLPLSWKALPNKGLFAPADVLAAYNDDLYVGGSFSEIGDQSLKNLGNIVRYNKSTNTWHAFPNQGLNDRVWALVAAGDDLYVGGSFTATGDGSLLNLGGIARYNIKTGTWHPLNNNGFKDNYGLVYALAISGDDLYVGGSFTATGDGSLTDLGHIARYDTTTGTWYRLSHKGLYYGTVYTLALSGDDLYIGGLFDETGDRMLKDLGNIVRYDTTNNTWYALDKQGLHGIVNDLEVYGDDLYVGGTFWQTGDKTLSGLGRVVRYDMKNQTWNALSNQGLNHFQVNAVEMFGSDLYVGGDFTGTDDGSLELRYLARYDTITSTWHALPNEGLGGQIFDLEASGSELFVNGFFSSTIDGSLQDLGHIARLQSMAGNWYPLPKNGLNDPVRALAVSGDNLFAGGDFYRTGDASMMLLGNIVRYDIKSKSWHALPNGGLDDVVHALTVSGNNLYVGGEFTSTGDGKLSNLGGIARYDIKAGKWYALPRQGLDGPIYALEAFGANLYAGGAFTGTADGMLNNFGNIARFNPAANEWYPMPNQGFNSYVYALVGSGDNLYAGGAFSETGDISLQELGALARYNTTDGKWHSLPNKGINYSMGGFGSTSVRALEMLEDDLYAAGYFNQTGDTSVKNLGNIARCNTKDGKWFALPNQGLNYWIFALDVLGDDLYVGGWFSTTGDKTLQDLGNIARYDSKAGKWHPLPNKGVDYIVYALEVFGHELYAAGEFSTTGDGIIKDLGNIARQDLDIPGIPVYLPLIYKK